MKSWINRPDFLWQEESKSPNLEDQVLDIANEDREVITTVSPSAVKTEDDILSNMVERISSWKKLLRLMEFVMKFVKRMKEISADENESNVLNVEDMRLAEVIVLQHYQETEFKEVYMEMEINQKS